jgi:cell division protein FtsI/penicillin-binding protein 2
VAGLLPIPACGLFGSDGPGPDAAAREFLGMFAAGDTVNAARLTDSPDSAKSLMDKVRGALTPAGLSAQVQRVDTADGAVTARVAFTVTWDLGRNRRWSYPGEFELRSSNDQWKVHWEPAVLHPNLAEQQSIALQEQQPTHAPVLDRDGEVLLEPDRVVSVLLEAGKAGDLPVVARQLAAALSGFDATITQRAIVDEASRTPDGQPYQVVVLRDADYELVKPQIYELPGVRFTSGPRLIAADKQLAPQVLPGIRKLVEDQVAGKAGWRVVTTDVSGAEIQELHAEAAKPAEAVTATLSRRTQQAAQSAIAAEPTAAMIVAMQPSTGELVAVAQNAAADQEGAVALSGRYPPGSTFKIATTAAALESGMATADTPLGCPGTITIEGRLIPNSNRFDKGVVPLHSAFAFSCNTTFAELAARMSPDTLTTMAKRLGIGVDFVVPGLTTVTGSVPPASNVLERASAGFGQGKVVVSPFGMALAVSTVATGSLPKPSLVRGSQTQADTQVEPIAPTVVEPIRAMMREVVTGGTAAALGGLADVRGKTGTAQFGDGTHAHGWFAGYQGDLAFAVLIVDAGDSTKAVQAAARFLSALG